MSPLSPLSPTYFFILLFLLSDQLEVLKNRLQEEKVRAVRLKKENRIEEAKQALLESKKIQAQIDTLQNSQLQTSQTTTTPQRTAVPPKVSAPPPVRVPKPEPESGNT